MSIKGREEREIFVGKLFNFRPLFFSAVFLCLGILFYYKYRFCNVSSLWLLCVLPLAAVPFCFCRSKQELKKTALAIGALVAAFFVGFFGFLLQTEKYTDVRSATGEGYVIGRVVEKREYGTSIGLVLTDVIIGEERVNGKLVAYLDASYAENIGLSDEIILQGKTEPYAWKNGEFVFSANALGDNLRYRMSAK